MDNQNQTPTSVSPAPVATATPASAPVTVAPTFENKVPSTGIVTKGEKFLAMFGYIEFLCVLPLSLKPKSKFCQFHGKQSLVLVLLFFILSWIAWVSSSLGMLIAFAHIAIIIVSMVQASQGKYWRIPFVAQVADKLNWDE